RGYGATAHEILAAIHKGTPWRNASYAAFGGEGSMGNGAAMRVAPLGAYFADDLAHVAAQADLSAEVTHAHREGRAGGIAVAVAAAWMWQVRDNPAERTRGRLFEVVLDHTPPTETHERIEQARALVAPDVVRAAGSLGNGSRVTAPDTVPFCLWCVGQNLD